ncbi:transglycosylase SLT domain-containing protein [Marinimicrobium sp. ABcell2]|uniref:transglycosylase SLT domain-containing protein n=1 Tax=Marinimicrobium sp. ABcell2 TaxID=3069751 RepID=UPI0027B3EF1E|nr:transglycosylase SLT domain-containing protein [Marinimicrobium sp. ABcell2]MDQ2075572.1 transglycosylase SLT domain-containing protein [Marinimicrobium sp. ABcell2]
MWAILRAGRSYRGTWAALAFFSSLWAVHGVQAEEGSALSTLEKQRETYLEAQRALGQRQMQRYQSLAAELEDYPLLPYLQYQEMTRSLSRLTSDEVANFLYQHPYSYLGEQLRQRWLHHLAGQERWDEYRQFYHADLRDTRLNCYQLFARLHNDDISALDEVAPLWNVGQSQPNACDPLFARWMEAGRLTPEIAWERHSKALKARNRGLAAYVGRLMSEEQQRLAALYREVDLNPDRLSQMGRFSTQSPQMREIILHGLDRLARRDAPKALHLWHRYDAQQLFEDHDRLEIQQHIATRLVFQNRHGEAEKLLAQSPYLTSDDLTERLIRNALRQQDWQSAYNWLEQLPEASQQTDRWRYWRARLMEELELEPEQGRPSARDLYAMVAATRGFYGFLSADILGYEYRLLDRPVEVTEIMLKNVEQMPGITRARELLLTGDVTNASREWFHTTRTLDAQSVIAAGKLAEHWGWYRTGIQATIRARSWDDLQMRFPLAYREQMDIAAEATSINPHLLFAIARQESAFMADARSPAGALGLMQLMPTTAQYTARRAGIPYRKHDLLSPETNIDLGSRYLHQLLNEFNGNRILAAAAYNAGPTRVRQWLGATERKLPYDVWIETIPFQETRGYVQNVLAFSVIYGYRLGELSPVITPEEAQNRL